MSSEIDFTVKDGVATLSLNRPAKRNAVTSAMWEAMIDHLEAARDDVEIRVLVVRGSEGVFCAGADLSAVKRVDGTASPEYHELAVRAMAAIASFPVPSVALIEGPCIGGGCSIALACDVRFAEPTATFGVPAVRHGIIYDSASLSRLVDLLGPGQASRFMSTAVRIDGTRARQWGLVEECSDDLESVLDDFVSHVKLGDRETIALTRPLLRDLKEADRVG